jgi:hypothetical protein
METFELINKKFESVEKMIGEVTPVNEISKIACVEAEIQEKFAWQWLFVILGIVMGIICVIVEGEYGIDLEFIWQIIVLAIVAVFAIPALIKGMRSMNDMVIETKRDIYVFKHITYNKKLRGDFDVSYVYKFTKGDLHEYYYFGKYLGKLNFFAPFHVRLKNEDKNKLACTQVRNKKNKKLMSEQLKNKIVKLKEISF